MNRAWLIYGGAGNGEIQRGLARRELIVYWYCYYVADMAECIKIGMHFGTVA